MISRSQKIRLGVFLLISFLASVVLLAVLIGIKVGEKFDVYYIHYKVTVSGLEVGAPVKYSGVRVGKVVDISINPKDVTEVIVKIELKHKTPVKEDTKAVLRGIGITGLKYIELSRGTNSSKFLKPGAVIKAGTSEFDQLTDKAQVITERLEILLSRINKLLSDENIKNITKTVENLKLTSENIKNLSEQVKKVVTSHKKELDGMIVDAGKIVSDFKDTVHNIKGITAKVDSYIKGINRILERFLDPKLTKSLMTSVENLLVYVKKRIPFKKVSGFLTESVKLIKEARNLTRRVKLIVMDSQDNIEQIFETLLGAIENIADFSSMLKEDPSILIKGSTIEEKKQE